MPGPAVMVTVAAPVDAAVVSELALSSLLSSPQAVMKPAANTRAAAVVKNRRVRIGVVYPQIELGGSPDAVRAIVRATEDLGFDYLLAYDHVLGAVHDDREPRLMGPYTEKDPFHDPLVMFAYAAGITSRIGFTTGVLILP